MKYSNFLILFFSMFYLNIAAADLKVYQNALAPDFASIQDAIDAAEDGDNIYIDTVTFLGNVSISNKAVSLYPMRDNGMYTINGSLSIFLYQGEEVYIQGLSGGSLNVNSSGSTNQNNLDRKIILNGCLFTNSVAVSSYIVSNIYYSIFNSNVTLREAEFIANEISGSLNLRRSSSNFPYQYKIYANYFSSSLILYSLSDTHIANNYFKTEGGGLTSARIYSTGDDGSSDTYTLIENNSFVYSASYFSIGSSPYDGYTSESYAMIYLINLDILTIRNNYFKSTYNTQYNNNYKDIYATSSMYNFSNNIINAPDNLFSEGNGTIQTIENNIYDTEATINNEGIITSITNTGADIPECRDIDNTINDVGTYGGPHSWENYHSNSDSKAQILDLEIPYYQVILPGVELQFNSKAIHKN